MSIYAALAAFLVISTFQVKAQSCRCDDLGDCAIFEFLQLGERESGCHNRCVGILKGCRAAVETCRERVPDLARTDARSKLIRCAWRNAGSPRCSGNFLATPARSDVQIRTKRHGSWGKDRSGGWHRSGNRYSGWSNRGSGRRGHTNTWRRNKYRPSPETVTGNRRRPTTVPTSMPEDYREYQRCVKGCFEQAGFSFSQISDKCAREQSCRISLNLQNAGPRTCPRDQSFCQCVMGELGASRSLCDDLDEYS